MKKNIYVGVLTVVLLVLMPKFVLAAWDTSTENRKGIYYCTKDLHKLESASISSDKSVSWRNDKEYIQVSRYDDIKHTAMRHCFVVFAEEMASAGGCMSIFGDAGAHKVIFRIVDSLGYGVDRDDEKFGTVAAEHWLLIPEERNKFSVSCTNIMREGDLKDDGTGVGALDLVSAFDKLSQDMRDDARQNPYNLVTHNCCSVAYNNVANNPFFKKDDVSNINKRSYNILGMGIGFEWTVDDLAQIIMNCPAVPVCFAKDMLVSSSKSSSYIVTNIVYLSSKKGVDNEEIEGSEKKPVETESSPKIDIEKTSFDSDDSVAIGSKKNNAEDL